MQNDIPLVHVLPYLTKYDCYSLRCVCKNIRGKIDDIMRTQRHLKLCIQKTSDPRYLLRNFFVPHKYRKSLIPEKTIKLYRPPYPEPSPWIISNLTVACSLSTPVDPRSVFYCVDVIEFFDMNGQQIQDIKVSKEEESCEVPLKNGKAVANSCIGIFILFFLFF